MNKLLFFTFISAFSLFAMEEQPLQNSESRLNSFIKRLKSMSHFSSVSAGSAGLLTSASLYGLSKTNFPLLKNIKNVSNTRKCVFFFGSGFFVGALFFVLNNKDNIEKEEIEKNKTGLIRRPNFNFFLTDEKAQEYLDLRIRIKKDIEKSEMLEYKELEEYKELNKYIEDIVAEINKKYWTDTLKDKQVQEQKVQVQEQKVNDFFSSCDINKCKNYKLRIFNEYISFDNLVQFINNVDREKFLYLLRYKSTIRYSLQGELIDHEVWKTVGAEKLAAFLAFGYYTDTCLKFLYFESDKLMTFLENAVYYMYMTESNEPYSEEYHYYRHITKVFEEHCCLKLIKVEFSEDGKQNIKSISLQKLPRKQ